MVDRGALLDWLGYVLPGLLALVSGTVMSLASKTGTKILLISILVILIVTVGTVLYMSKQPNITFETGNDKPFRITSEGWVFARVRIYNGSSQEAYCRLFLTDLQKDGETAPILKDENIVMGLANQDVAAQFNEVTIGPSFPMLFDVGYTVSTHKDSLLVAALPRAGGGGAGTGETQFTQIVPGPLLAGTYKFTLRTNGKNCVSAPWHMTMKFGGWPNLTVH